METNGNLAQAIRLNNVAAAMVTSGNLADSIRILRGAADILWSVAFASENEQLANFVELLDLSAAMASEGCVNGRLEGSTNYNQEGMMYIHDRLFVLSANLTSAAMPYRIGLVRTLSFYILYNLALVYHLHGRVSDNDKLLAKAKGLYRQILRAVKNRRNEALLQCMVLNGLADLHHRMCEFDSSVLCFDIIMQVSSRTKCFHSTPMVTDEEVQAILLNQLLAQYPSAAKAA